MEKALISQKELALDLKAMRVWLFESGGSFIYISCSNIVNTLVNTPVDITVDNTQQSTGRVVDKIKNDNDGT